MSNKNRKPVSEPKTLKHNVSTPLNMRAIILGSIGIILTIVVCVLIAVEQLYEPPILTVNGTKYKLSDLRYSIFNSEYQGYQSENFYQSYMGTSYWDQVVDEESGKTNLDQSKEDCLESIIRSEILYQEAVKQGYTVSDEDKTQADTTIESMKEQLDDAILRENGFTNSYLKDKIGKIQMLSRFQQDKIDSFDIDDQAITDGINYEDYHEYELGVFSVSKTTTDAESGESVDVDKETLKASYDRLVALKDTIVQAEDLSTVLGEDEQDIQYASRTIMADDTTYGKKNVKKIVKMENGTVMDVFETDDAYYLIKMINNAATSSYDTAVSNAISSEETTQFDAYYEELKEAATIEQNTEAWDDLNYGNITFAAY